MQLELIVSRMVNEDYGYGGSTVWTASICSITQDCKVHTLTTCLTLYLPAFLSPSHPVIRLTACLPPWLAECTSVCASVYLRVRPDLHASVLYVCMLVYVYVSLNVCLHFCTFICLSMYPSCFLKQISF